MTRYEKNQEWRKKNPEKIVGYRKKNYQKHKEKINGDNRKYYREHKEESKKYQQEYNRKNKTKVQGWRLTHLYNISLEEVDALLIKQQHRCPICKRSLKETLRCVDHDHKTGKTRGILCSKCNLGIGHFEDDPDLLESAVKYLSGNHTQEGDYNG
jgi:DNA repair exonuclease SbcCD ATPase subunit